MKPTTSAAGKLRQEFASRIANSSAYRHGVLRILYARQTPKEQDGKKTCDLNSWGFTATDAAVLSRLAERLNAGVYLNDADESVLREKLPKYWAQCSRIMELGEISSGVLLAKEAA
jgi:hypothetical protein